MKMKKGLYIKNKQIINGRFLSFIAHLEFFLCSIRKK